MTVIRRYLEQELEQALSEFGAVVIEGPKWCGKTFTAAQLCKSHVYFDIDVNARRLGTASPRMLLDGEYPRLFDEWQFAKEIWNQVRAQLNEPGFEGHYVLTGSAMAPIGDNVHTGTGRFHFLTMRTMSSVEANVSSGAISLSALNSASTIGAKTTKLPLLAVFELICRGGWPALYGEPTKSSIKKVRSYVKAVVNRDLVESNAGRNPALATRVLKSLARNVSSEVKFSTIAKDVSGSAAPVKDETVSNYMSIFSRMMITEDLPAWNGHLRSSYALRTSPKRYFSDPSIAAALLLATPENLLADLETAGLLFENLVMRDLRVYAQHADATVSHFRDASSLEVDAIIESYDGTWGAIEIKLSDHQVDVAAASLLKFRDRVDTSKQTAPKFLAVVTNTEYSYTRPDGVHVISITALGA